MSKQRRPPERETSPEGPRAEPPGPALEEQASVGHEVARGAEGAARLGGVALATSPGADLAGRVALALRFAPRDAAQVERLVAIVERSGLSAERRDAVVERLRGDLDLAGRVADAVREALGRDDPAERSALVVALDRAAADDLADGGPAEQVVAERVAAETGHAVGAVEALCRALSGWILWWEEEEEEAPPGDYAAEESGT